MERREEGGRRGESEKAHGKVENGGQGRESPHVASITKGTISDKMAVPT